MIYLASPYFSPDPALLKLRVQNIKRIARQMMIRGDIVFSPIAYSAALKLKTFEHADWMRFDLSVLSQCSRMVIVPLQGWRESKGVAEEIAYCTTNKIPWQVMDEQEFYRLFAADPGV